MKDELENGLKEEWETKIDVNPSRLSTESVMNHQGYGDLYITINGIRYLVPENMIALDGRINKDYLNFLRRISVA